MNHAFRKALEVRKSCRARRSNHATRPVTYAGIVRAYLRDYQQAARAEPDHYANLPSPEEVVARASRAQRPDGKRHDHQTRIGRDALDEVARRLKGAPCAQNKTSSDLHSFLERRIGVIPGIGELMVYDTALRIGAKLGLESDVVYLYRGTRSGMKALGKDADRPFVRLDELPHAFKSLRPHKVEDCLCIYKAELAARAA